MRFSRVRPESAGSFFPERGFTLIELLAVIVIVAVLAAILISFAPDILKRAEAVRCTSNLKQLHVAFSGYIQDHTRWPQLPDTLNSEEATEDWWIQEMEPYGLTKKSWQCPTVERLVRAKSSNGLPKISYFPTQFDAMQNTPFRWPTQPWFIEIGDMHGHGALVCFPDGSIKPMDDILQKPK